MRRHLHLQDWDLMLVGDIETKWLRFKAILLDLVENFCNLARSRRLITIQKKKKLYKKFLLTRSQEHGASYKHHNRLYTLSFWRSRAAYEQNIVQTAISDPKVHFWYVREGTKKRDPIPGVRSPDGSIETNDEEKTQSLANHFQTVNTRERSLPDVGLPSHTENAKIEYVQILCNDVKKI